MHVTKTFRDLGVDGALCDALEAKGITHPFPIQELTLPIALQGHDLIGQARTGTGKTLAFGLPLLQRIDPGIRRTQALVVVPTRELCLQVHEDLTIGTTRGLTSISVYGGVGYEEQTDALTKGAHVVVGTPGRLLDLLQRRVLDLSQVTQLVLDEADEMLDMGFLPDVERLIEACKGEHRHTMLFSATMPTAIVKLARRYMDHPTFTRADHEQKETAPNVTQHFFQVHRMDKPRLLARILQDEGRGGVYVFVRTKHMADRLVADLEDLRVPAIAIHGDLRQQTRERNLDRFREGKATVLVCTEVAARGLDVAGVTHVVNYDCPDDEKMYLHRIGRTARAGGSGVAVTFAEFNEVDRLNVIRKKVDATDRPVQQVFSTSPVLAELFTLPTTTPWEHLSERRDGGRRTAGERHDGGRRSGGTDGRPKSGRNSEGRGGAHDARPRRDRPRSQERDEAPTGRTRTRPSAADAPAGEAPAGAAPTTEPATPAAPADRPRVRARTRTTPSDTGGAGDAASQPARGDRTRTRDERPTGERQRSRREPSRRARSDSEGSGRDRADDGSPTERAPRERSGGSRSGENRSGGNRSAGSDAGGTRSGGESSSRDRSGSDRSGRTRSGSDRSGRTRSGSDRSGRAGSGNDRSGREPSGRERSGRSSRGKGRDDRDEPGVTIEGRGAPARGEGQPQLARRVRVEHLP